jgi:uncharacterized NAD(P)/FAD-binding protein YdhS
MSSQARKPPVVAIVGGGCAGTLVASNLLRRFGGSLRVVMIERSGRFGPGVAYATEDPRHLLNVPAAKMSAFREAPSHFLEWAAGRLGSIDQASYLPRGVFGEYLRDVLNDSRARALPQRTLELVAGEVLGASRTRTGLELQLADAAPISCDRVVLATGPPGVAAMAQLPCDPRVVCDPWASGALGSGESTGVTLVLGTGLSGVDAMLSLSSERGQVLAISRSGQLPHVHLAGLRAPAPPPALPSGQISLAALDRRLTEHVSLMQGAGYDWRDAIDGMRAVTPQLWGALGPGERKRFLHERRRAWDARRHRMAPAVGARLRELLASAQLRCLTGHVLAARSTGAGVEVDVATSRSGGVRRLTCERVVVCTGAGMDIRHSGNVLLDALLADGLASPDPLALGLRTTAEGALLDARGDADMRVFTLGALRRGELWETTAVDEIRSQAERLVGTLERSLSSGKEPTSSPAGARRRRARTLA